MLETLGFWLIALHGAGATGLLLVALLCCGPKRLLLVVAALGLYALTLAYAMALGSYFGRL